MWSFEWGVLQFWVIWVSLAGHVGRGHWGCVGAMPTAHKPSHTECRAVSELRRTTWKYVYALMKTGEKRDCDTLCTCMMHKHKPQHKQLQHAKQWHWTYQAAAQNRQPPCTAQCQRHGTCSTCHRIAYTSLSKPEP